MWRGIPIKGPGVLGSPQPANDKAMANVVCSTALNLCGGIELAV